MNINHSFLSCAVSSLTALLFCSPPLHAAAAPVSCSFSVDPARVEHTASQGVHGQFLEHIFHSVHGGLWGDMILNPSLEPSGAVWLVKDETVTLSRADSNKQLRLGDPSWDDYDLQLEARRDDGFEGFVVMFRVGDDGYYWAIFGGAGNKEHRIEKNGRTLAKLRTPGSIEKGRWYRVRISCRGPKFSVWLDDTKLFESEDKDQALLRGGIGLNSLRTQASFRNLKVSAPDGKVLFARLPAKEEMIAVPAYWKLRGKPGSVFTQKEGAFNDATSLVLSGSKEGGECGIEQDSKSLAKGEKYRGSLWLRSPNGSTASVRLRDAAAGTVLFEQAFENLPAEWSKREFSFKAAGDVPDAVFEVVNNGEGKGEVQVDMINLFSQSSLATGGFRPDLLEAVKALKPASIRYPGGTFIIHYCWKDSVGPREKRRYYPAEIWADRDASQFGTDEFMELCRQTGAEPVICVRLGNLARADDTSLQEALDWLEYCNGAADTTWGKERAANGHPAPYNVKIWEIGNEAWNMEPVKYAAAVRKFSEAMKAKDPSIRIAACGAYGYDNGPSKCDGWNKTLLDEAAKYFDLLSIHYYNGIGGIGMPPMDFAKDPLNYEAYIRDQIGPIIRTSANPKIKVYCSEWGQMNIDWRSGLYAGGILNGFERLGSGLFEMSCPAVWMQAVKSRSNPVPRWASSHILFDSRSWCGVPVYVVQKLWREHFGPKVVHLEGSDQSSQLLNALASTTEDGRTLFFKVVNPGEKECAIELEVGKALKVSSTQLKVIAPGNLNARNTLDEPNCVVSAEKPVSVTGQKLRFTLPAQSAGALKVQ